MYDCSKCLKQVTPHTHAIPEHFHDLHLNYPQQSFLFNRKWCLSASGSEASSCDRAASVFVSRSVFTLQGQLVCVLHFLLLYLRDLRIKMGLSTV